MYKIRQGDIGYYDDVFTKKRLFCVVKQIEGKYLLRVKLLMYTNILIRVHVARFVVLIKDKSNE